MPPLSDVFVVCKSNLFPVWHCRYAYGGDTGDDYDEEAISLTTGVKVEGGEVSMVVERKEKKGLGSTDHLIGLTEDLAEDKRE